jgi:hypothetical protein
MSGDELPPVAEVEEISLAISDGLKSCRSMVANYRAMIRGEANDNAPDEQAAAHKSERQFAPKEIGG